MPGVWGGFLSGKPAQPAGKQLMLPRLMNLLINPFVPNFGAGQKAAQKAIYPYGENSIFVPNVQSDYPPQWPMIEFTNPAIGALKTGRSRILLPEYFVLLGMWASASVNTVGGFRVMVYDVNRRVPITIRPCNFNTLAGPGNSPLFQRRPYPFGPSVNNNPPMAKITVVNLENAANSVQFGFYGMVDPGYCQD